MKNIFPEKRRDDPKAGGQPLGDVIDFALKVVEERRAIKSKIREAIIAGDDAALKIHAKKLVGIKD